MCAENDSDAITKAIKALDETSVVNVNSYIKVNVTGGASDGRIYLDPLELTVENICNRETIPEIEEGIPF
jgi:hypothetical protein